MLIAMIDNYDSFTFNLVQYLRQSGAAVLVFRNDETTIEELETMELDAIVLSPGPGRPQEAGISLELFRHFSGRLPLLGVCLGHQCLAAAFGGDIVPARTIMHGKTSTVTANGTGIFKGITRPFTAMRYHSLAVSRQNLPDCLHITAEADDGEIMGLAHKIHPTQGVQFHPESIMTTVGKRLIRNFIKGLQET
ncbi:MAG: aminodeoxychorismate/anthranilate synthase component II [Desulfobacterium sp.]|jgi:anthranilate synthase/aminodeoxychorismate synthase-like glutamine amidotransferase|nr:aminodeoxychorismate/anthranilate synthase component II [Desulfobacterium sp.]